VVARSPPRGLDQVHARVCADPGDGPRGMGAGRPPGVRARSAQLLGNPVSARPSRARGGIRGPESAGRAPVHEARGARPGLPDVTLHRRGMGKDAPRGAQRMTRALGRAGLAALLLAAGGAAWAHVGGSTGYASIQVSRGTVRYSL